jgi:predicted phage tail protein
MLRNVYLQGELGDNFGRKFRMEASKIIAAIVLFQFAPQLAGYTTTMTTTATGAVVTSTVGSATALTVIQGIAINLGMAGLAELMAPDPSVDEPTENSDYLYTGSDSVSNKYDPIPVLYGELRVPGKLVDFNVTNGIFLNPTNIQEADGDITVFDDSKFTRSGRGS